MKIDNEASNTRLMRAHQKSRPTRPRTEETDLVMCTDVLDYSQTMALNSDAEKASFSAILAANPDSISALVSDVDQQLILKIVFKEPVCLTQVSFRADRPPRRRGTAEGDPAAAPADSNDAASSTTAAVEAEGVDDDNRAAAAVTSGDDAEDPSGPSLVKCFANQGGLDFCEADCVEPDQVLQLLDEHITEGVKMPLRGSRFQRCDTVQFFVEENQSNTDKTFLNRLCLWGYIVPT